MSIWVCVCVFTHRLMGALDGHGTESLYLNHGWLPMDQIFDKHSLISVAAYLPKSISTYGKRQTECNSSPVLRQPNNVCMHIGIRLKCICSRTRNAVSVSSWLIFLHERIQIDLFRLYKFKMLSWFSESLENSLSLTTFNEKNNWPLIQS